MGQNVIGKRFAVYNFTGSGCFEAFGSRTIGFNFRHCSFSLISNIDGVSYKITAHATVKISI
jgi:hypothetical protein